MNSYSVASVVFNPWSDDNILDWSILEQIADDILTVSQMTNLRLVQTQSLQTTISD